jgi:ATP-binding cassette subfamily C protein/ATP-binding cassette subfamily C protein LapB
MGINAEGKTTWWINRFSDTSARLAEAEMMRQRASMLAQIASSTLVSLTVIATLSAGALLVIDGSVSVGVLIASIALVWRMTAPLPGLLQARLRWFEIKDSINGTSTMLDLELEAVRETGLGGHVRSMAGRVGFSSVMMSYQRGHTAAVRNVSFEVSPGEIVAVTGHSGAGKSTILDLIAGIVEPQFGTVTIDGINPRQISPSVLRQSLGYLARDHGVLPLSIREYLQLGVEFDLHSEIKGICARTGLLNEIETLPR